MYVYNNCLAFTSPLVVLLPQMNTPTRKLSETALNSALNSYQLNYKLTIR